MRVIAKIFGRPLGVLSDELHILLHLQGFKKNYFEQ